MPRAASWRRADALAYIAVQIAGALIGVWIAHLMFDLPMLQVSEKMRSGPGQWLAECVATFGLLLTIFGCVARAPHATPVAVGLYITAAYWFTASTSFANPAVTLARAWSNTFAGIAPAGVAFFIAGAARRDGRRHISGALAVAEDALAAAMRPRNGLPAFFGAINSGPSQ